MRIKVRENRTVSVNITFGIEHILPSVGNERQFVIIHLHIFQFVGFHGPPVRNTGRTGTFAEVVINGIIPLPDFLFTRTRQQGDNRVVFRHAKCENNGFAGSSSAVDLQCSVVFALHVIAEREIAAARFDIRTVGLADLPEGRNSLLIEPEPDNIGMLFFRGNRIIGILIRGNISQTVFRLVARQAQNDERQ